LKSDCANWAAGRRVLMNRSVDAAVIENSTSVILREGLAYDRCQVGIITNIDDCDRLGEFDIGDADRMFNVLRTQVDVVLPTGTAVLNARDTRAAELAELCDGEVIFFGIDPALPPLAAHLAEGGRAVYVREGRVVLATGTKEERLSNVTAIPLTLGGRVDFQLENVLAAVAAGWALGVPTHLVRVGIETFDVDMSDAPWQFTAYERAGATAVVDGAHNASALRALIRAIDKFPSTRRTVVYGAGRDRRDEDLLEQAQLLGAAFDRVILYDDATVPSKRPPGQARALLREGLLAAGRVTEVIDQPDHAAAADVALSHTRPGDFVLMQSGEGASAPTIDIVRRWVQLG
jgi:cyanophycin synthetase